MSIYGEGEGGWFKERTKVKYNGEQIEFYIHPEFFRDSLSLLNNAVLGEKKMKLNGKNFVHVVSLIAGK